MTAATSAIIAAPAIALVAGSLVAVRARPSAALRQALQHLAAGLVFAAVAVELIPHLLASGWVALTAGFAAGTLAMLGLRSATAGVNGAAATVAVGVDVLIDGAVLGAAPDTGAGRLLSAGLAGELLFLGLTLALTLEQRPRRSLLVTCGLAAAFVAAGALSAAGAGTVPQGVHAAFLSFGTAAMLFLVVEELLVEAHEVEDTPLAAGAFFAGFLVVLVGAAGFTQ